jgi:rhodanese-related sulfurtransferase
MSFPEITVDELARRLERGAVLVDVRQPDEYAEAHVPGAVLIPLNELPDRVGDVPKADEVLVICRSGGRSAMACEFLEDQGINAVNVVGGTLAWLDAGRAVDTSAP